VPKLHEPVMADTSIKGLWFSSTEYHTKWPWWSSIK
jgi:hypothetical protein